MNRIRFSIWAIIAITFVIAIIIPFSLYFSFFNGKLSSKTIEWSNFATFWSAFISIGNIAAVIYLARYFQKYELERNIIIERPIISIHLKQNSYEIANVGKGAALNIIIYCAGGSDYSINKFTEKRTCYSLKVHDAFTKEWLNGELIIVEYNDIFNEKYYSMMRNDVLNIFDKDYKSLLESDNLNKNVTADFRKYMTWDKSNPTWP